MGLNGWTPLARTAKVGILSRKIWMKGKITI